jgi:hypothetical protein
MPKFRDADSGFERGFAMILTFSDNENADKGQ